MTDGRPKNLAKIARPRSLSHAKRGGPNGTPAHVLNIGISKAKLARKNPVTDDSPDSTPTRNKLRIKDLKDPSMVIGKSPAGRPITLAEGVAAAKARVAADKLIPNAETPPKILQLAEVELFKS